MTDFFVQKYFPKAYLGNCVLVSKTQFDVSLNELVAESIFAESLRGAMYFKATALPLPSKVH